VPGIVTVPDAANFNWSNLWAIDANTAWGCFYDASGATGGGIFKTTDGGGSWTQQGAGSIYVGGGSFANIVYFWDANNGFAQGDPVGGYYELYTTTDGGSNWTRVPQANIPAPLNAAEFGIVNLYNVNGNTFWFGTNNGRMFKSTDKGLNWTVSVVSAVTTEAVIDVAFRTANEGIAIVADAGGTIFSFYKSTDGGATWNVFFPTSGTFYPSGDLEVIPNSTAYVSTGANATTGTGSSYSVDGGDNWTDIDVGVQHTAQAWVDGTVGWCGGFNVDAVTDGIFKYSGTALGVQALNNDNARMKMFPNPSTGQFSLQISGAEAEEAFVKIVDVVGNVAFESTINNSSTAIRHDIDLSTAAKGIYIVTVENGTTRFINKIVID